MDKSCVVFVIVKGIPGHDGCIVMIREMIKGRQIVKNHADALRACL